MELEAFHHEFFQDVMSQADAEGQYAEDAFFNLVCDYLIEAGELETADRAFYHNAARGLRIDGYGGDPESAAGILTLVIADFQQSPGIQTLTGTEMDAILKRATAFLSKALEPQFRQGLEETTAAFGLTDLIARRWNAIARVRIILASNRLLSSRVEGRDDAELNGKSIGYSVWDLGRLHRLAASGRTREDIEIDLDADFGGALPALPAHLADADYEAYLIVIPGEQLARIYDHWGSRLLEQNVRVFLQARGNVNKGIRETVEKEPEMFLAYNNGITATAERVTTRRTEEGLLITGLSNLQIVNGGQTTASIHAASRKKDVDLSRIFVQMKLSIVEPARALDVVPKISQFANTQNRVSAADFFANHPFHVRMEEFSRRIYAPSPDGTFRESKWFYERARGQYQDARAYMTVAQRRKFDLEYPKRQLISKTDLAKYLNVWRCHPDIVSKGAQKNFAHFAEHVGKEWRRSSDQFNENYFRHAIAKAIIFRKAEKLVTEQSWYEGGYRANVVAYAIAKIAHDVQERKSAIDFDRIWRLQDVPSALEAALVLSAETVHEVIVSPPAGMRNVTEWAKQQACWNRVSSLTLEWSPEFVEQLLDPEENRSRRKEGIRDQKALNGIEAQTLVVSAGAGFWQGVRQWGTQRRLLTPMEAGILDVAASGRVPSDRQSLKAMEVLKKLQGEGCEMAIAGD